MADSNAPLRRLRRQSESCSGETPLRRSSRLAGLPPDVVPVDLSAEDDLVCHLCQCGSGALSRSRCCGVAVHLICRDPDQLCLFCGDELCSEVSDAITCCIMCTLEQNEGDSLIFPCCRNRLHFSCFVQCVQYCGPRFPFCAQDILGHIDSMVRDGVFRERGLSVDLCVPPSNSTANSMQQSAQMPAKPNIRPLCCNRVSGPPDFSPLEDRRMEWSPIHPQLGQNEWTMQWICRCCARHVTVDDLPSVEPGQCPACSSSMGLVVDVVSGRVARCCTSCP